MKHVYKVLCKDYNGNKNILFQMEKNDFRLKEKNSDYQIVCEGVYDSSSKTLTCSDGKIYHVFFDWSIKEIQ